MNKTAQKIFSLIIISVLAVIAAPKLSFAQTQGSLTVAPARQIVTVAPGESVTINVKFINQSESPLSGPLGTADFLVEDKAGTPVFFDADKEGSLYTTRFAAASWVKLTQPRITVPARDKVNIQAKVTVPKDALPGGRYFAIYFEPGADAPLPVGSLEEAGLGISSRIAALIYMRIAGPIEEKAVLSKFTLPTFVEYGPIDIEYDIINRGNYHIRPTGTITLTDMLGRRIATEKLEEQNIFPDATKSYRTKLGRQLMIGRFTVSFASSYGDTGQVLLTTAAFWAFPIRLVLAILLGVTAAIMLVIYITRKMKGNTAKLEEELKKEITEVDILKKKYQDTISEHTVSSTPENKEEKK